METSNTSSPEYGDHHYNRASYQAYQLLHIGFTLLPLIAGIDKFFDYLTFWEQYLSKPFNILGNAQTTMLVVGIVEIIAGIGVWLKPKIFAYVVAAWVVSIIINLLIQNQYYDIALRDVGLIFAALALGRLSQVYDHDDRLHLREHLNKNS